MTFQTPTTKAELVEVLKQIDDYYRYREDFYEEPTIIPLDLKKIEFTPKTEDEISSTAFNLFTKKRSYEISQKQAEINAEIIELQAQKKSVASNFRRRFYLRSKFAKT